MAQRDGPKYFARSLCGLRLVMVVVGADLVAAGGVLAGGYDLLSGPSRFEIDANSELEHVVYDIPHWPFSAGLVMLAVGAALVVGGWYTSPRWRDGLPLGQWGATLLASVALCTGAALIVLVVVGRHSEALPTLLILTIIVMPIGVAVGTREWR